MNQDLLGGGNSAGMITIVIHPYYPPESCWLLIEFRASVKRIAMPVNVGTGCQPAHPTGKGLSSVPPGMRVVVKIMVPFWIPIIIRHLIYRLPKMGP